MKKYKSIAVFLFALISSASLFGCEDASNGTFEYYDESSHVYVNPNEKDKIAQESASVLTGNIGEITAISGLEVNVKRIFSIGERQQNAADAGKSEIILADVEVKNNNSETVEVASMPNFEVSIDGGDAVLAMDLDLTLQARQVISDYKGLNAQIEPGQTADGYIIFEVPEGWKSAVLKFYPMVEAVSYDEISYFLTPDMIEKQ